VDGVSGSGPIGHGEGSVEPTGPVNQAQSEPTPSPFAWMTDRPVQASPASPRSTPPSLWDPPSAAAPPETGRRRRSGFYLGVVGVAVVALVGAVIGLVVSLSGPTVPGSGMAPTAYVQSATQTTLQQRTADLVISGNVTAAGSTQAITGSGDVNLTENSYQAKVNIGPLVEQEVIVGGHCYLGVSEDGQNVSTTLSGKPWVDIPIPVEGTSTSLGAGTSDPLAQMKLLPSRGNKVTPLGTKAIDGTTVSGYSVTMSRQRMMAEVQQYLASTGLSSSAQQLTLQAAETYSPPKIDVWFDSSNLLRRMTLTENSGTGAHSVMATVVMDFVNYGAPVAVTAPAPQDVVSYSQFVAAAQAAQKTQTS
jgi:hypothetical protein